MSTPIEPELKSQLDRVQVQLRPGLAREAHQAYRRHRVRRRSIAAASTVIAVAVAITLVATGTVPFGVAFGLGKVGPGPTSPNLPPGGGIPPAGLHPAPPADGLSARQAAGDIVWMHSTLAASPASDDAVSNTFIDGSVFLAGAGRLTEGSLDFNLPGLSALGSYRYRDIDYAPGGKPTEDVAFSSVPDAGGYARTITAVLDQDGTWAQDVAWSSVTAKAGHGSNACTQVPGLVLAPPGVPADPAAARALLSCPVLTITRGAVIDGIGAIKLTDPNHGGTLWINAVTYLPIESVLPYSNPGLLTGPATSIPQSSGKETGTITTLYGYLAPAPSNLAYLSARVPAGFRGSTEQDTPIPTGKYTQPWVPPGNVIPPFALRPVPASDSLTPAQASQDVLWTRTTTQATHASDTVVDSSFAYRTASRDLTYTPSGQPWDDDNTYVKPGTAGKSVSVHTVVNYDSRTVSVQSGPARAMSLPAQDTCATAQSTGLAAIGFAATPDAARGLLDCSGQQVTRGLTLGGVDAIKIAGSHGETLWVNATTYLPIEIVIVNSKPYPPAAYNNTPSPGQVIQYTWLPPTSVNLSYLGIPTPSGFSRTQLSASAPSLP
jgi:hypothetical protein